ncbi:hypothetical protein CSPX01_08125 [Colletotrichum filicis]|nr:hypothetical protein CSPX01_08125 [Colletotrichum filicis]
MPVSLEKGSQLSSTNNIGTAMNSGSSLIQQQNIRDVEVGKSQFSFQYPKVWTSGEQGRMTTSRYKPRAEASR